MHVHLGNNPSPLKIEPKILTHSRKKEICHQTRHDVFIFGLTRIGGRRKRSHNTTMVQATQRLDSNTCLNFRVAEPCPNDQTRAWVGPGLPRMCRPLSKINHESHRNARADNVSKPWSMHGHLFGRIQCNQNNRKSHIAQHLCGTKTRPSRRSRLEVENVRTDTRTRRRKNENTEARAEKHHPRPFLTGRVRTRTTPACGAPGRS